MATVKLKTRNIRIIKNLIKRFEERFDMSSWGVEKNLCDVNQHDCGTIGCIAGFCRSYVMSAPHFKTLKLYSEYEKNARLSETRPEYIGRLLLGLTEDQADQLFLGRNIWVKYHKELGLCEDLVRTFGRIDMVPTKKITAKQAIMMLEKLASGEWTFD